MRAAHLLPSIEHTLRPVILAVLAALSSSCASTQTSVCDPVTIEQNGRCFWSKEEACDAAGCLPPSTCDIVEGKPAHVTCHKSE